MLIKSTISETFQDGSSDDFDLPVPPPPPPPPAPLQKSSSTPSGVAVVAVKTGQTSFTGPDPAAVHPTRGKTDIAKGTPAAINLKQSAGNSANTKSNNTTAPEMPAITIDDHPLVAALVGVLCIISSIFFGSLAFEFPMGLIMLIAIYGIAFDFFHKRKARALERLRLQILLKSQDNN